MIRIGLIGAGSIAMKHAEAVRKNRKATLSAVYSTNKLFAKNLNVKTYTSFSDFLDAVDAVIIANRNNEHVDYALKSILAGKHVLIEKPLAASLEDAERLLKIKKNVVVRVVSQHRLDDSILKAKKLVTEGKIGKPIMASVSLKWHRDQAYYDSSGGWRKSKKIAGGGVLIQQAVHFIDILQWILGDVDSVQSKIATLNHTINVEDTALAILNFKNGALGVVEATTNAIKPLPDKIEIHGTKGSLIISGRKIIKYNFSQNPLKCLISSKLMSLRRSRYGTLEKQFKLFINEIHGKEKNNPISSFYEGFNVMKTIDALYRSAKEDKEIKL